MAKNQPGYRSRNPWLKNFYARALWVFTFTSALGLVWLASEWWEKGWATPLGEPLISPNGCYRLETFEPFWVLPATFHLWVHPDDTVKPEWFAWWGYPGFYRLYDHRSGMLIAETRVYDVQLAGGQVYWGDSWGRTVSVGNIRIGRSLPDCIGGGK